MWTGRFSPYTPSNASCEARFVGGLSGSNPVFGLNTLGGALSIQTKSGHDNPGTEIEAYGGSFGRRSVQGETGGEFGAFDYFFSGNYFDENGWRDLSSTRVWQGFGKIGWQTDSTDIDLSYTYADTTLYGDGSTPLSMLYYRREQTYTPDFTQNLMNFVNLTGTQSLTPHLLLTGSGFYRYLNTDVGNGNVNDYYLESNYAGPPTDCTDPGANAATLAYCTPGQDATSTLTQRSSGIRTAAHRFGRSLRLEESGDRRRRLRQYQGRLHRGESVRRDRRRSSPGVRSPVPTTTRPSSRSRQQQDLRRLLHRHASRRAI